MAHLIFDFQPPNFVKSHNFCRKITERSLVIISESVSDLEKSGGSAPSIYIQGCQKEAEPFDGSFTNWAIPIIFHMVFFMYEMKISWKYEGHRCNIKKIVRLSFYSILLHKF